MLRWDDFLQLSRVRAIEEADAKREFWSLETRRAATQEAAAGAANPPIEDLLSRRSSLLLERAPSTPPDWKAPDMPPLLKFSCWAAAFAVGWVFAAVGQESEINLLALPLIGVLAWNVVVIILSVIFPAKAEASGKPAGGLTGVWLSRFQKENSRLAGAKASSADFLKLVERPVRQRLAVQLRLVLHLGAAFLALGSISAMYARGWSKEYRAVWESTLLDEHGAAAFFGGLFAPASAVTGIKTPVEDLPVMRRGPSTPAERPGQALPWIHLYAVTLALGVVLPRFILTGWETWRLGRIPGAALRTPDWADYKARVWSQIDRGGANVEVLIHGLSPDDATGQDRWRLAVHEIWPDAGGIRFLGVPVGEESAFLEKWQPGDARHLLLFSMAATPEVEIHRWLVDATAAKLRSIQPASSLKVALDDETLKKRWLGLADGQTRLRDRRQVWEQVLHGAEAEVLP